jgi:beta-galactosidase
MAGFFYQSQRDPGVYGPMVHICNYWTSSSPTNVVVVSNCEQVELYQDGALISKKTAGNLYTSLPHPCFSWTVPFKSGQLKAIGYVGGAQAATHIVTTPGSPTGLTVVPDTNVIFEGGDMTRVVVSMVDATGQVLHLRADSVTVSASGAADFIGEAKTALEGGQIAYYVKTRASQTGAVTCQASSAGFSATATINVVKDPGSVSVNQPGPARALSVTPGNTWVRTVLGDRFALPSTWARKGASVSVYDMNGRFLYSTAAKNGPIDFAKTGAAAGVHIVKLTQQRVVSDGVK